MWQVQLNIVDDGQIRRTTGGDLMRSEKRETTEAKDRVEIGNAGRMMGR